MKHPKQTCIIVMILLTVIQWLMIYKSFFFYESTNSRITFTAISFDELLDNKSQPLMPPKPIDIVITWAGISSNTTARTRDNQEMKHCLRSIQQNIRWYNHIYIVVSEKTKIDILNGKTFINQTKISHLHNISIISHLQIFYNPNNTIDLQNSDAIECNLHHIPNLSQYYIYFNDDTFIGEKISYKFFFNSQMVPRMNYATYSKLTSPWPLSFLISTFSCISQFNNITIHSNDIPYNNKHSMVSSFPAHIQRPFRKTDWIEFENKYPKFFRFMSSQKQRIYCGKRLVSIQRTFAARIVRNEGILPLKLNIFYLPNVDYLYSLYLFWKPRKLMETRYHFWAKTCWSGIRWISNNKPLTWCINDGMHWGDNSRDKFKQFIASQFPNPSKWETIKS